MSDEMQEFRDELAQHGRRLDDHLQRIVYVEGELDRARKRMHRLENDRATVRALVRTTQELAEQTRVLAAKVSAGVDQAERLVESAAERAIQKLEKRRTESRWRRVIRWATVFSAVGGFGFLIAYLFSH